MVFACVLSSAQATQKLDTAKIDAALGRSGSWAGGVYLVDFFRPNLPVTLAGVQLAPGQVDSFATFTGAGEHAEMMGEVCALPGEVTAAVEKLRAGGVEITGIHNHFLGESPRLMFVHFMAHGNATDLAGAFRAAVAATTTPLGKVAGPRQSTSPAPAWAKAVESAYPGQAAYSADYGWVQVAVPRADFPQDPTHDFWFSSFLSFQQASGGKVATTGDIAVTAAELNPVLSALTQQGFTIFGVHNHMTDEQPRLFFVHFWKIGTPAELTTGLKAAMEKVHSR
jgi:hypothetical protein